MKDTRPTAKPFYNGPEGVDGFKPPRHSRLHPQNQLNQARCDLRAAEIAHARWDESVNEYDLLNLRAEIQRLQALLALN